MTPRKSTPILPEPMPDIRAALLPVQDARDALSRPIWNRGQLEDALRSAEWFIQAARAAIRNPS